MLGFILAFSVRIVAGILFLIAGFLTYRILKGKNLPVIVAVGALILGLWGIIEGVVQAYTTYIEIHSGRTMTLYSSFLSLTSIILLVLFIVMFVVGINEIAKRASLS